MHTLISNRHDDHDDVDIHILQVVRRMGMLIAVLVAAPEQLVQMVGKPDKSKVEVVDEWDWNELAYENVERVFAHVWLLLLLLRESMVVAMAL